MVAVRYEAPQVLSDFLESDDPVRCVMGPVGSGKSSACVLEILRRAQEQVAGPDGIRRSRWAVIRNTYPQLRDTTRKTFEEWIPAPIRTWKEAPFICVISYGDVEAEVLFRALDRPEDVSKLLSLELTGAYINEWREIPADVFDVLETRIGRYPSKKNGGATWSGIWGDTNPWHASHWAKGRFAKRLKGYSLFRQPGGRAPDAENVENLPVGYYDKLCLGKSSDWVRIYVDGEEANSDVGSVYGNLLDRVYERGGVGDFEHPGDGVFTSWDLGLSDSTAIWFWRIKDNGVDFIGHYRAHGMPLSHYFDTLDKTAADMGWQYVKHWLPHDAAQHTLASQLSVLDQCREHFGSNKVAIGPSLTLLDGIQAGRWLLEQPGTRFHERCGGGITDLREYRYEWDELLHTFGKKPLHNFASHTADAYRGAACVAKVSEVLTRKAPVPVTKPVRSLDTLPSLDELFKANEGRGPNRRIA